MREICENMVDANPFYFWTGQGPSDPNKKQCNNKATHYLNVDGCDKMLCKSCLISSHKLFRYDAKELLEKAEGRL